MNTLTAKQTAAAGLLTWAALAAAFATGMQMRPKAPQPQVFGRVLARGSQHEILIAVPAGEASAPVIVCNAGMRKSYDDCRKKYQALKEEGWDSEN